MFKKVLNEVRAQPEGVRLTIFWLCLITTSVLVGFVWFKATETRLVALMQEPAGSSEQTVGNFAFIPRTEGSANVAVNNKLEDGGSWLGSIAGTFRLLGASIGEFFSGSSQLELGSQSVGNSNFSGGKKLPLSSDK